MGVFHKLGKPQWLDGFSFKIPSGWWLGDHWSLQIVNLSRSMMISGMISMAAMVNATSWPEWGIQTNGETNGKTRQSSLEISGWIPTLIWRWNLRHGGTPIFIIQWAMGFSLVNHPVVQLWGVPPAIWKPQQWFHQWGNVSHRWWKVIVIAGEFCRRLQWLNWGKNPSLNPSRCCHLGVPMDGWSSVANHQVLVNIFETRMSFRFGIPSIISYLLYFRGSFKPLY